MPRDVDLQLRAVGQRAVDRNDAAVALVPRDEVHAWTESNTDTVAGWGGDHCCSGRAAREHTVRETSADEIVSENAHARRRVFLLKEEDAVASERVRTVREIERGRYEGAHRGVGRPAVPPNCRRFVAPSGGRDRDSRRRHLFATQRRHARARAPFEASW